MKDDQRAKAKPNKLPQNKSKHQTTAIDRVVYQAGSEQGTHLKKRRQVALCLVSLRIVVRKIMIK